MLTVTGVTIGVPVKDLRAAQRWYEAVLDVDAPDLEPVQGVLEHQVGGAWLQLSEAGDGPGGGTVRIGVPDVHEQRARLVGLGVEGGDVEVVDGVIAWWDFSDPDSNRLSLYTLLAEDGPLLAAPAVEVSR